MPLRIPYGVADFVKLRLGGEYYVDKTHYLPQLENAGRYLFLIRPRRFGKSLLQTMMACYYDINRADQFDALFHDTWIHAHPTAERSRYLMLRLDFSRVHGSGEALLASFDNYCRNEFDHFLGRYEALIPASVADQVRQQPTVNGCMKRLIDECTRLQTPPMYLFIDEYDNFANTLLASEGRAAYQALTHGRGFFRDFFAELKGAVGEVGSPLARLFITGVSPVTLDDVSSGFNIALNITRDPDLSAILGFTPEEMRTLFSAFGQDYEAHRPLLDSWYNHYRFSDEGDDTVTNSDMALYYLQALYRIGKPPKELIDQNVRIDYVKLRHLIQLDRQLNGSFVRLREIIDERQISATIQTSFPAERLQEGDCFVSLLFYFGLLTYSGRERRGQPVLVIPNRTIDQLMYSYLREAFDDVGLFRPDLFEIGDRLARLAWDGDWQPFFAYLSEQISRQAGVRDHLGGEKLIQGFLLAWLNVNPWFYTVTEQELGGGFVDFLLYPSRDRYPGLNHAYLIELKYLTRTPPRSDQEPSQSIEQRQASALQAARAQLTRYRHDQRILPLLGEAKVHALVLIWNGWELLHSEQCE